MGEGEHVLPGTDILTRHGESALCKLHANDRGMHSSASAAAVEALQKCMQAEMRCQTAAAASAAALQCLGSDLSQANSQQIQAQHVHADQQVFLMCQLEADRTHYMWVRSMKSKCSRAVGVAAELLAFGNQPGVSALLGVLEAIEEAIECLGQQACGKGQWMPSAFTRQKEKVLKVSIKLSSLKFLGCLKSFCLCHLHMYLPHHHLPQYVLLAVYSLCEPYHIYL